MKWLPLPGLVDWMDEDLLRKIEQKRREDGEVRRTRKLGTVELLWLMLAVSLDTGKNGLHDILRLATANLDINWRVSTAAFCKARMRFSPPSSTVSSRAAGAEAFPEAWKEPGQVEGVHPQSR